MFDKIRSLIKKNKGKSTTIEKNTNTFSEEISSEQKIILPSYIETKARNLANAEYNAEFRSLQSEAIREEKFRRIGFSHSAKKDFEEFKVNKEQFVEQAYCRIYQQLKDEYIEEQQNSSRVKNDLEVDIVKKSDGHSTHTEQKIDVGSSNVHTEEKLIDIVNAISSTAQLRKEKCVYSVARVNTITDGEKVTYWFLPNYINLLGEDELKSLGRFVPKNSYIAIQIQTSDFSSPIKYTQMNNIKRYENHTIALKNRANFENKEITLAGDSTIYQYRNIHEFFVALQENNSEIIQVRAQINYNQQQIVSLKSRKETATERGRLTKEINKLKERLNLLTQQQEDLRNITIYIRKQGEIRHTHIIDPIQTRIMSQNLFDGKTIIIDGGPGTGKTTTMIHRLGYLTDIYAIEEDAKYHKYNLTNSQRNDLLKAIEEQRDWMFFSPSQMLKDYLANAMKEEGLKNTSLKVWNWKDYCKFILQADYRLLENGSNNAPFKVSNSTETLFSQNCRIIEAFTDYYLDQLRKIKEQLPNLDNGGEVFVWTSIAKRIKKKFDEVDNYHLSGFISLFNSLQSLYGNECILLQRENRQRIDELTDEICTIVEQNPELLSDLSDILKLDEDIDDEAETEESENDDSTDLLRKEIRVWLRQYSYYKVCPNTKLKEVHIIVAELICPILNEEHNNSLRKIGELALFEQYAKYTNGVGSAMLGGFPKLYKGFRTHLLNIKLDGCNRDLIKELRQVQNGRKLHHQEQALIVGFINNLVKAIIKSGNTTVKHTFVEAFEELSRPIIGIDEATDFSECDIYAMHSLLNIEYSSLTLCGDIMQRLTDDGIESWDALDNVLQNKEVVEMKTSYRQSTKVLDVARQLYIDTIGKKPKYKAYMTSSKVPRPLVCVSNNEYTKIEWIGKRLEEVYRAYGKKLPSIAIFVNDKGEVSRFIEQLQKTEFIKKTGVALTDSLQEKPNVKDTCICVYPIEVVKGMEFDVVFFHNIDNAYVDKRMLKRYIYVGVSRAAFFLGITLNEWDDNLCKYFEKDKDWFKI